VLKFRPAKWAGALEISTRQANKCIARRSRARSRGPHRRVIEFKSSPDTSLGANISTTNPLIQKMSFSAAHILKNVLKSVTNLKTILKKMKLVIL
jgi:hypothetical protein